MLDKEIEEIRASINAITEKATKIVAVSMKDTTDKIGQNFKTALNDLNSYLDTILSEENKKK